MKLCNIELRILKVYIIYNCKFCIFDIAKLLNIEDRKNLLLIIIRLEKALICLNIIYSLLKYDYQ